MRKLFLAAAAFGISATFAIASPSFAQAADPTTHQVYEAIESGHLDQAQQMITQVLASHPNSAKAHYAQAELFAKQGKIALARAELGSAERLNPGLTEFSSHSVQELKSQLGQSEGARAMSPQRSMSPQIVSVPGSAPHFPWGALLIGVVVALRPATATLAWPALIALVGSFTFSMSMITTRTLRGTSDTALVTAQTLGALAFGAVATPFGWTMPSPGDGVLLALLGIGAVS